MANKPNRSHDSATKPKKDISASPRFHQYFDLSKAQRVRFPNSTWQKNSGTPNEL